PGKAVGGVCRPNLEGSQAGRSAGAAAQQVRACSQSSNRKRNRAVDPPGGAKPRQRSPRVKRVLVKCGWLVTLDPGIGEIKGGELIYRGNTIEAAGRNLGASADEVIDAADKIVMPGR